MAIEFVSRLPDTPKMRHLAACRDCAMAISYLCSYYLARPRTPGFAEDIRANLTRCSLYRKIHDQDSQ